MYTFKLKCYYYNCNNSCRDRFKGDAKLAPSDRIVVEKEDSKQRLTIKQIVAKDAVSYTCKATNVVGTATATAKLKVKGR